MTVEIDLMYVIYALVVALNFFLGTSILLDRPDQATNRHFFLFILAGMGWVTTLYYYFTIDNLQLLTVIGRMNFAFAALSTYGMYNFVRSFLSIPVSKKDTVFAIENILIVIVTIISPLVSSQELIVNAVRETNFGPLYLVFVLHMVFYMFYSISLLLSKIYKSRKIEMKHVGTGTRLLAFGVFSTFLLGIITNVILPYFLNYYALQDYAPVYTLFLFGFSAYAIGKHHIFNLKVVSTELFTYVLWLFVFIRFLLASSASDSILDLALLILVVVVGMFLIRSVIREVEQRLEIENLAADLSKANTRLTELDRQKSEFVSFATHQLRAPLTAMKGYASLLLEGDMGKLTAEAKNGVQRIYDSTETLVNIVNDYLNISRIELGTMKYAFDTIDLRSLVEDVIAEIKPNIDRTGLKFTFTAEDGKSDYRVTADRDKLKQVIANLIDNSLKYTPSGSVDVTLGLDRARHVFVFKVKDTGVGISPETLPRLFQKFSRADNASKTNIRGTGLGLYVAKQMIEAHHGTIRAESPGEGKGSTFIVELEPLAKA